MAIEGVDGSGKTTQAMMVVNKLNGCGYRTCYVRPIYVLVGWIPSLNSYKDKISPRRACTSQHFCRGWTSVRRAITCLFGYTYALMSYLVLLYLGRNNRILSLIHI